MDSKFPRAKVHIVLTDHGWIIEEMGRHLVAQLPYVTMGAAADPAALIQYYMTYSARRERISPVEIALFTHREEDANAARAFDEAAKGVDHAVSMSRSTDRLIERLGVTERSCISPGVDIEGFRPKLKIAVVGRTYHTGRKGEALVRAVMDIPDIEWHFTGEGWPGPALNVPAADLPAFYRAMDYVLVPATNEGGPMCVLEALACGTPVIGSDVGWTAEYPHIPFERGNPTSLRNVLLQLRDKRFELHQSVANTTWQRWVSEHDELFERLGSLPILAARSGMTPTPQPRIRKVGLVTHGAEDTTLGGPSVRVPRTKCELERLHLTVRAATRITRDLGDADVVHGFNIWTPLGAYRMARQVQRLGRPLIFSPILLDLSEGPFWQAALLRVFRSSANFRDAETRLDHAFAEFRASDEPPIDFEPGYRSALSAINDIAAATIFLSDRERALFERLVGVPPINPHLVRNPVDTTQFDDVSLSLFRETHGLTDYVLCVGRLEHRKNQLVLAAALASTDLPLVLVGHEVDDEYTTLIRQFGGERLRLVGRLEPGSPMLRSAIAGARVFALPSWAEGAPLAALEAGAAGVPLVLSNRSGEQEYFGSHASYCDPASVDSIRSAVLEAWHRRHDTDTGAALRDLIRKNYSWHDHAEATRKVYETVADTPSCIPASPENRSASGTVGTGVIFDITTWANNAKTLSGIVRVECAVARALLERDDVPVRFIVYSGFNCFTEVPREIIENGSLAGYVALMRSGLKSSLADVASLTEELDNFSDIVTVGSSWMQNAAYSMHIAHFARRHGLRLNVLMHDLTPYLFPQWYMENYADVWTANCRTILSRADRVLVYSNSTARDVEQFCFAEDISRPQLVHIRLADEIGEFSAPNSSADADVRAKFAKRPFVLAVGAIHVRKNYGLLFDVWTMLNQTPAAEPPNLVIVGGTAWNGADVARAFKEDPRVKNHIHILSDIDDATLAWLYEHCLFTVYPSLYEGWGLPVGESLARGRICLSSNSSSMAEIAPAVTDLLPPLDRAAWAARIAHYARSASSRAAREDEIRRSYSITTWRQTASDVLSALRTPFIRPRAENYILGAITLCHAGGDGIRYLEAGWHPCENWGVWSGSKTAIMRLALTQDPGGDLVLTILGTITKRATRASSVAVTVNGTQCGTISFLPAAGASLFKHSLGRVLIPHKAMTDGENLEICFTANEVTPIKAIQPDTLDDRELGLGLTAFTLEHVGLADDAARLLSTRPEVRAVLKVANDQDLAQLLTESRTRPMAIAGLWHNQWDDFKMHGAVTPAGLASVDGMLAVAIGTSRLRLDASAQLDLVIGPDAIATLPAMVMIYANDELVGQAETSADVKRVTVQLPPGVVGRADPLRLVLFGSNGPDGTPGAFVLGGFRIGEVRPGPSHSLAIGQSIALGPIAPELAYPTGRLANELTLLLKFPDLDRDSVLAIDAGPGYTAKIESCRREVTAVASVRGCSMLAVGRLFDIGQISGGHTVRLILQPGGGVSVDGFQQPMTQLHERAVSHLIIKSPHRSGIVEHRYVPGPGWNEVEDDGRRWGADSRVGFWVRPDGTKMLLIVGEVVRAIDASQRISVFVDGILASARVHCPRNTKRITIRLVVPESRATIRYVEIDGLQAHRPCDFGINDDTRWLSFSLIEILALPSRKALMRALRRSMNWRGLRQRGRLSL